MLQSKTLIFPTFSLVSNTVPTVLIKQKEKKKKPLRTSGTYASITVVLPGGCLKQTNKKAPATKKWKDSLRK